MPEKEKKKALVIGVSEYDKLRPPVMKFCENDANEVANLLGTAGLGYKVGKLIGKVSWLEIRNAARQFFISEQNLESRDTLLFYFSGHGLKNQRK